MTACSEDSASSKPKRIDQIDHLTGRTTAVKLDKGFLDALKSLELTPGVVGKAELTKAGSLVLPISAGNVTYFKPGTVSPYVQGNIQHDGSGLSLSAGGTEVELTDFEIDPGTSKLYGNVAVNNEPAVDHAFLFQLDGSTLKPGLLLGIATITINTK